MEILSQTHSLMCVQYIYREILGVYNPLDVIFYPNNESLYRRRQQVRCDTIPEMFLSVLEHCEEMAVRHGSRTLFFHKVPVSLVFDRLILAVMDRREKTTLNLTRGKKCNRPNDYAWKLVYYQDYKTSNV